MGVLNVTKEVDTAAVSCDGILNVTLGVTAEPDLSRRPTDVVLVLDRSGSMGGNPLQQMKLGAKKLIDMVTEASGGTVGGTIGGGSRMAVVSFSNDATVDSVLSADAAALRAKVDGLVSGGSTSHAEAIELAQGLFDDQSQNERVMILFTDGVNNGPKDPNVSAAAAKAAGTTIFCIGLRADPAVLGEWASDPNDIHVAVTTDETELERLFGELGAEVVKAGALDVVIDEVLAPDFKLVSLGRPSNGVAVIAGTNAIQWTMGAVGVTGKETATLSFQVMHIGTTGGVKEVNASAVYRDRAGSQQTFPSPTVTVTCGGTPVIPEPCPKPTEFRVEGCQDSIIVDLAETHLASLGRIIQMDATLRHICPDKRVALAVLLTEVGPRGEEYSRGMKTLTIPAHNGNGCRDVEVKCIRFVVPEDLDASGGSPDSLCNARSFKARVMANYIDTDFVCCDSTTVLI